MSPFVLLLKIYSIVGTFVWQLCLSPLTQKGYLIMSSKLKGLSNLMSISLASMTFLLLRCAKVSPIVGADFGFFSLSDAVMPLSGVVSLWFGGLMVALRMGYKMSFYSVPVGYLVYHIPGFCAAAYWATEGKLVRVVLPLACMVAFIAHPVGWQAAPYCLYWLIPVAIYFIGKRTAFLESLGSTFIAHAVGSVIWLYMFDMSATMWLALIPVVALERLFFASTMTVVYNVGHAFRYTFGPAFISSFKTRLRWV
jgi:hypothetical protein